MAQFLKSSLPPPCGAPPQVELMAFLQGYFDESGKHKNDKVVSFCGFVDSNWLDFEDHWNYLLRKNRIGALHLSKDNLKATEAQLKIYRPFIQAIKKHVEWGVGFSIDVDAFNSLHKAVKNFAGGDPHYYVFHSALREVVRYASTLPNPSIAVICDDEPSKACECYKMFDRLRQNVQQPENRKTLKSIAFADDEFYPQLQAADLFSWVGRAESLYKFHGLDYSLRQLYQEFSIQGVDCKTTFETGFWGKEHLKEVEQLTLAALAKQKAKRP